MPMPKVSIIVNNYNYARYLGQSLDSALGQTYAHCEVLVVDDGSTDGSREILERYRSVAKVLLKPNGGQASAFNLAFVHAQGDLIAFLDSDDILHPEAIAKAVEAWQDGWAKFQFPLRVLDEDGVETGLTMPRNPLSGGDLLQTVLQTGRYVSSPTSGNVYARSFLEQILPIPEQRWAQTADGYINTAAPFFGPIGAATQPLGGYRVHGGSMSSVAASGKINFEQINKLMRHAEIEQELMEDLARRRGFTTSKPGLRGHWMHLKLRLAFHKLVDESTERDRNLFDCGKAMVNSVLSAPELSKVRKVQHLTWTLSVLFLPVRIATEVIRVAFDPGTSSPIFRMIRRAGG